MTSLIAVPVIASFRSLHGYYENEEVPMYGLMNLWLRCGFMFAARLITAHVLQYIFAFKLARLRNKQRRNGFSAPSGGTYPPSLLFHQLVPPAISSAFLLLNTRSQFGGRIYLCCKYINSILLSEYI